MKKFRSITIVVLATVMLVLLVSTVMVYNSRPAFAGQSITAERQRDSLEAAALVADASSNYLPIVTYNIYEPPFSFFDDFSDLNSGWSIVDYGAVRFGYQNGAYEILLREANSGGAASAPILNDISNYSVEVDMHRHTGNTSQGGLFIEREDWEHYYYFVIHSDAQVYALYKRNNGWQELIPFTYSGLINTGNGVNHLRIERNGALISLFVNGVFLASAGENDFTGEFREVGVRAAAFDNPPNAMQFDNFLVEQLSGAARSAATGSASEESIPAFGDPEGAFGTDPLPK